MKHIGTLSAVLFLVGCSTNIPPGTSATPYSPSSTVAKTQKPSSATSIFIPAPDPKMLPALEAAASKVPFEEWKITLDKEVGFTMRYPAVYPIDDPKVLPGLSMHDVSPSPHCENIGVSKPDVIEDPERGIRTIQGKKDPIIPEFEYDEEWLKKRQGPYTATYVLCSEKGDKEVRIEIHQVTDDPALAKQIFDTFRWTE